MFRRRRSADTGRDWTGDSGQELPDDELDYDEPSDDELSDRAPAETPRTEGGPWDAGEPFPE